MYRHGPSCLEGPFSRARVWWTSPNPEKPTAQEPQPDPRLPTDQEELRLDLIRRVRREIAEGTYDTPDKWQAALERLFRRLG